MRMRWLSLLLVLVLLLGVHTRLRAETDPHIYVTGTVMEIDRCASAWLISRYVDEKAEFEFLSDQELMSNGKKSFDTPFSKLRRTHNASTFEAITKHYALKDDRVAYLAALIHELEINFWNKEMGTAVLIFQIELDKQIRAAEDNHTALQACFDYLDSFSIEESQNVRVSN